ncbi:MAG: hypothetical protein ACTH1D_07205 [Mycobacteriaceae bacterium]|uniref:hypothetical protein n=1 Tax=Corynebacterium sp. TaxID=1720 RepID=UPI003F985FC3
MTTTEEQYRPAPSGRFAVDLTDPAPEQAGCAPEPKASPAARFWTVLLGLVFLVVCGTVVRDILVINGSVTGEQVLPGLFDWLADLRAESWMLWAGIGCAVVALLFLAVTLRPRRRTHIAFGGDSRLYGRPVDIARLSTAAARRIPGVLDARTVATRRKIHVTAVTAVTPDAAGEIRDRTTAHVSELAELLDPSPAVTVTVTQGGGGK